MDPGSAAHHHSASKTRVNALSVLRSIRGTQPNVLHCERSEAILIFLYAARWIASLRSQ
jgi:hypothetical protein